VFIEGQLQIEKACWELNPVESVQGRFPFDQKAPFEISNISRGKWNSKSRNFPVGYTSPVGPNRSIQFWKVISRNLRQGGTESGNFSNGKLIAEFSGCSNFPER